MHCDVMFRILEFRLTAYASGGSGGGGGGGGQNLGLGSGIKKKILIAVQIGSYNINLNLLWMNCPKSGCGMPKNAICSCTQAETPPFTKSLDPSLFPLLS